MTPIGLFTGETALVTGSASNIGRAIALALAAEGAQVRCVDVDAARNGAVVDEIVKAGGRAEAVTVDLSTADGWQLALPASGSIPTMLVHSASPRGGWRSLCHGGDLGRDAEHQPALGILPGPRARQADARGRRQGAHAVHHLAACRDAA